MAESVDHIWAVNYWHFYDQNANGDIQPTKLCYGIFFFSLWNKHWIKLLQFHKMEANKQHFQHKCLRKLKIEWFVQFMEKLMWLTKHVKRCLKRFILEIFNNWCSMLMENRWEWRVVKSKHYLRIINAILQINSDLIYIQVLNNSTR